MEEKQIITPEALSIDKTVTLLGGLGLFQALIVASFMFMSPPRVFQVVFMIFGGQNPTWRCAVNSTICTLNGTLSRIDPRRCNMPRSEWEYTVPRDFSTTTEFDLQCDREWIRHLMNSILFVGWAVGAVTLGYVADNHGRRSVIYPSQVMVVVIGFLMSFVKSVPILIVCRFVVGVFIPAGTVQSFILISEYVSSKHRSVASILLFLSFTSSTVLFVLKAYFVRKWRMLSMVCTAPYIVTALSYFFVPESIRFIRLKGKQKQLDDTLKRMAYWNRKELPTDLIIEEPGDATSSQRYSVLDVFRTRRLAIMACSLGFAWLANGMVYYSLVFASNDFGGSIYRNVALLTLIEVPGNFLSMYLANRIGRKKTVVLPMMISAIFCIAIAFIPRKHEVGLVIRLVCAAIGRLFIGISFNGIYLWSVEVYPTTIRANAMGFFQITSRIGSVSAPWIAIGLLSVHVAAPYLVMGLSALVASLLLLYVSETKGRVMLETSQDVVRTNATNVLVDEDIGE